MSWLYKGELFDQPQPEHYGFVYTITNKTTNKTYIGKKLFWFKKTKQVKGKKKRYLAESDWKEYYGSSPSLHKDIEQYGAESFTREIIHLCRNKGECSYMEALEQFQRQVLFFPELYYNDWIIVRVHRKHVLNENATRNPLSETNKQARPKSKEGQHTD